LSVRVKMKRREIPLHVRRATKFCGREIHKN
jgi:hypothetical protein